VLLIHHVLSFVVCIISHLVLHYWLILELLQAEILLIGSAHVSALLRRHELLALIPSGVISFDWNLCLILLSNETLLLLMSKLLLFRVILDFPRL